MTWLMLDNPAWDPHPQAPAVRAVRTPAGTWLVASTPVPSVTRLDGGGDGAAPIIDTYDPATLHDAPMTEGLRAALHQLGPVRRLREASLWDALATAIIRQVIRARQARAMHHAFRHAAGDPAGSTHLLPTPEQVLALSEEDFAALGMAFKRRPLQAAATAYMDHPEWAHLAPDVLIKELQSVPRIGPWTAAAAVADHTGDFSFYPHCDLAVRTWAAKADPATVWPADDVAFAAGWRNLAGPHLSTLTVLILAWGDHHAHQLATPDQGSPYH
jgi:DNA-3-methyladenine glycosylase II